jgi:hypothetical protein
MSLAWSRSLSLAALFEAKQLLHEGQFITFMGWQTVMHIAIEDWFNNIGLSLEFENYEKNKKEYRKWQDSAMFRQESHLKHGGDDSECSCSPELEKPSFLAGQRRPCLLSEVLAASDKVKQIDSIPVAWLEYISEPIEIENTEHVIENKKDNKGVVPNISKNDKPTETENGEAKEETEGATTATRPVTDAEKKARREEVLELSRNYLAKKVEKLRAAQAERRKSALEKTGAQKDIAEKENADKDAAEADIAEFDSSQELLRLEQQLMEV